MNSLLLLACLAVTCGISSAVLNCGDHSCIAGMSTCEDGACVCQSPYTKGFGDFACYKKNAVFAEIKNDPMLTNFNNQSLRFPFPCRYLVTHVKQELKDKNRDVIGECEFKIYAFNAKAKGKFFTHGFDVATKIKYDNGEMKMFSSRNWGIAEGGNYRFWTRGTEGAFLENGDNGVWGNDRIYYNDRANKIKLEVKQIEENNQLVYEFNKCGVRITFVPYDVVDRRSQVSIPGLSVAINCAMHPQWMGEDNAMALGPTMDGGKLFEYYNLPGLSTEQSIVNRAFLGGFVQNQPADDDGQCDAVGNSLRKCNDATRQMAYDKCYWMLTSPKLVKCLDSSRGAKGLLNIFYQCIDWVCGDWPCSKAVEALTATNCHNDKKALRKTPQLAPFARGDMC